MYVRTYEPWHSTQCCKGRDRMQYSAGAGVGPRVLLPRCCAVCMPTYPTCDITPRLSGGRACARPGRGGHNTTQHSTAKQPAERRLFAMRSPKGRNQNKRSHCYGLIESWVLLCTSQIFATPMNGQQRSLELSGPLVTHISTSSILIFARKAWSKLESCDVLFFCLFLLLRLLLLLLLSLLELASPPINQSHSSETSGEAR